MTSPVPTNRATDAGRDDMTFVLTARGVVVQDGVLDLVDLMPSTICVTWSQAPGVGYLTTSQFLDLGWEGDINEADARFGLLNASPFRDKPVRLRLRHPRIVGSGLRWNVLHMVGWLPSRSGACVLVINPPEPPGRGSEQKP